MMEGSGSGSRSSSGRKGRASTTSPLPSSSISDLFGGERSARGTSGGLLGLLGNSNSNSRSLFTRQTHGEEETTGSASTNPDGTGAQTSSSQGYSFARTSQGLNGSNSQKGQGQSGSFHGKSQNVNNTFLGSSLYYGGPDLCCDPSTTKTESLFGFKHQMKRDGTEDDTNSSSMDASRGNWWQGSLYY